MCHAATAGSPYRTSYLVGMALGVVVWLFIATKLLSNGTTWGKTLAVVIVALGGWRIYVVGSDVMGDRAVSSIGAHIATDASASELRSLAASVKPGEVVMYSTTECGYCAQAKGWLHQYGFAFDECNMSVSERCESEFRSYGGNGTPYLVVRGHHMRDGFDSDEFVALLKQ